MRAGQIKGLVLQPNVWTPMLALDVIDANVKTWAIKNLGPNIIADGMVEVSMVSLTAPDADWMPHPQQPTNMGNIAAGAWATGTTSGYAFYFYRLKFRSALGTTIDAYVGAR